MTYIVAALYHFASFDDHAALRQPLLDLCTDRGIKGTLLLAAEGVNGTIAGSDMGIAAVIDHIRALPGCDGLEVKYSAAKDMPFQRMKVRLKKEIVTMKVDGLDPAKHAGHYVQPQDWNDFIDDPNTVVIDTRNDFEVDYGTFDGAIDPKTRSFGEFPQWWADHADEFDGKRIAMFCTGGIRCEKSTAFLRSQGVEDVYHLKGGILNYLEKMPQEDTRWRGGCFVFDERVSIGHGLVELGDVRTESDEGDKAE